ncbi:2-hydroxychromene-2-carboxylate isomerase [Actinomadura sp. KC06]|uniref:2-hydroxychromene-2-carboxylate isomerase n=1 Tax=Actinomadura sp. KC06 TaxID=2530369 RepID=UPI00104FC76B|nr:DsbA family protein [Actinomadura sp. KC06]TDD40130.1 2-hydroxychromene-2-carboxylate isomerase [Actinomadura sp. KC06]
MSRRNRPPRFYFNLRSPYSWLAYRDLLDRYPDVAEGLEWAPFWEPDETSLKLLAEAGGEFPFTPMSKAKHLYILQDVRRLAADRGLAIAWPVDREPWWEVPHLAYLVARRHGRGAEFIALAYRARWEEGRDICDPATVAGIGAELGLDAADLTKAVDDPEIRTEGVQALMDVYKDGVFGVPYFVNGFERFWGVDRLAAFAASVRGPAADGRAADGGPAPARAGGGVSALVDDGHAGGCG